MGGAATVSIGTGFSPYWAATAGRSVAFTNWTITWSGTQLQSSPAPCPLAVEKLTAKTVKITKNVFLNLNISY
jgi:hypothetical protein